jgi:hypothetical protein
MPPDEFRQWVISETETLAADHSPPVSQATVGRYLDPATGPPGLIRTLNGIVRRSLGLRHPGQLQFSTESAARLLRGVILAFILDPTASSLDLLPAAQRNRFRNFRWQPNDYPGNPVGPNEARARQLARALSALRPERRANVGSQAVVTRQQHTAPIERHIQANLRNIPAFPNAAGVANAPQQPAGHRLYERAQDAFVRMRAAAWTDGVPLIVLSSYRDPAVARARAAAAANPAAVASFSAHSLGLAVDLRMSFRYQGAAGPQERRFAETTTRPMQNVVDMRQSPAHKWMMLRGAEFGWFPYQNEPWHWEFNPPNFRQEFHQAVAAAQPGAAGGRP